eukprot:CAMPEP_0198237896 /NCGR_PEP_ID=MMETSP1446-20131203/3657_1 /TAXON_ID=1461542 ORGANISM="Unidentified sp, Strain CCMP2111" /NCGR_SAMPLE_ID=MMETSP1446 /ASSEMBLY_ACC=CAM_ASM_001112 /LENGTH=439 /DNA_ID=CAMNT_0043920175 /DNA_START=87 /DNA_END=1406 /DNA_ORIENTATION=-
MSFFLGNAELEKLGGDDASANAGRGDGPAATTTTTTTTTTKGRKGKVSGGDVPAAKKRAKTAHDGAKGNQDVGRRTKAKVDLKASMGSSSSSGKAGAAAQEQDVKQVRRTRASTRAATLSSQSKVDAKAPVASKATKVAKPANPTATDSKKKAQRGEPPRSSALVVATPKSSKRGKAAETEEKGRRASVVLKSAKKAARQMNNRLSGRLVVNKSTTESEAHDKPLASMTIKEIIRKSMRTERSPVKKRPRSEEGATDPGAEGGAGQKQDSSRPATGSAAAGGSNPTDLPMLPSTSKPAGSMAIAPQVQVVDGQIVINRESLSMKAQVQSMVRPERRVEESGNKLSAFSYSGYLAPEKWTKPDTDLFFQALSQFGTDFSLIQTLFPSRARRQIKSKFRREEKRDPARVEQALKSHGSADCVKNFKLMVDKLKDLQKAAQP